MLLLPEVTRKKNSILMKEVLLRISSKTKSWKIKEVKNQNFSKMPTQTLKDQEIKHRSWELQVKVGQ